MDSLLHDATDDVTSRPGSSSSVATIATPQTPSDVTIDVTDVSTQAARARATKEERRGQLLLAAQDLFASRGYHGAVMDDIAIAAGVSKPIVYQHFPGKKELYAALLQHHADMLVHTLNVALNAAEAPQDRVRALVHTFFNIAANDDTPFRLIFESDTTSDPQVNECVISAANRCADVICDALASDGGLPVAQARLVGQSLVGMTHTAARQWVASQSESTGEHQLTRDQAANLVTQLAWAGLQNL